MYKATVSATSFAVFMFAATLTGTVSPAQAGGLGGIVSEIKGGLLDHDAGRDSPSKTIEENTLDVNGEILSVPIVFGHVETPGIQALLQPRVHVGFTANTAGWTNTGYAGLTWDWNLGSGFFTAFSFGFVGHDGQLKRNRVGNNTYVDTGRPNLGAPVMFREGLDIGYHFDPHNSFSVYAAHISNAGWLAKENDGMNFLGGRYGYKFD